LDGKGHEITLTPDGRSVREKGAKEAEKDNDEND
jgi:hypothetical protein